MAIRTIRTEGDEILRKKSKKVEVIDEKIRELIQDMKETLHKYDGVGLAAVQVGILKQIVVIDTYEEGSPVYVLINPEIIETRGLREVEDAIEKKGIEIAYHKIEEADLIICLFDSLTDTIQSFDNIKKNFADKIIFVANKCDLSE